ncbi:MAG: VIT domain-containing protein [Armatimonadota bacterium]
MRLRLCTILGVLAMAAGLAAPAGADGMLIPTWRPGIVGPPPPNFAIKYHRVTLDVKDQVLTCTIDQVFHNEVNREVEGIYLFPAPPGVTITSFEMEVDGKPLEGKILAKEEARRTYESIVSKRKDPALLEYVDRETFRARVFPIPAKGDKRIAIRYTQLLEVENGICEIRYPLNTEKFSSRPLEEVTVTARIESREPIASVYSPSHEIALHKSSNTVATASYEEHDVKPDQDFWLYYTVADGEFGLHLLPHRVDAEPGYFLLMASPRRDVAERDEVAKDVAFVLDTSGSMAGEKIEQAKEALAFCLNSLGDEDRFNIVRFNSTVELFARELRTADEARHDALKFVADMKAAGGTNIGAALPAALDMLEKDGRAQIVVFLTDGRPTVGQTDMDQLLEAVQKGNQDKARIFVFGAGHDVNIHFLDKLALQNGGDSDYVRPQEDIEVKVSSFFAKLASPVLTDLALNFGEVNVFDAYPQQLPDLFRGSQLLLLGRYRNPGQPSVTLTGLMGDDRKTYEYAVEFPGRIGQNPFVPRLWAARKIGFLIDEVRLHGKDNQELIDEIIRLSQLYGIMTEYTSFLVEEGGRVTLAQARSRVGDNFGRANAAVAGSYAISQSLNRRGLQQQAVGYRNVQYNERGEAQQIQGVRFVAGRAFYNRGGVWTDATYNEKQALTRVQNFSTAQFQLSRAAPALNAAMALGERVLININGQAILIDNDGKQKLSEGELKALIGRL